MLGSRQSLNPTNFMSFNCRRSKTCNNMKASPSSHWLVDTHCRFGDCKLYSAILQHIFNDVEDFLDSDEWMEDDLVLTSHAAAAAASNHNELKSPPPYSHQSTLTDFGNTITVIKNVQFNSRTGKCSSYMTQRYLSPNSPKPSMKQH